VKLEKKKEKEKYEKARDKYLAAIEKSKGQVPPALGSIYAAYRLVCLYRKGLLFEKDKFPASMVYENFARVLEWIQQLVQYIGQHKTINKKLYEGTIEKYLTLIHEECHSFKSFLADIEEKQALQEKMSVVLKAAISKIENSSAVDLSAISLSEYKKQRLQALTSTVIKKSDLRTEAFSYAFEATLSQTLSSYALLNAGVLANASSEWLQKAKSGYAIFDKIITLIGAAIPFKGVNPIGIAGAILNLFAEISFQRWEAAENKELAKVADKVSEYFSSLIIIDDFTTKCLNWLIKDPLVTNELKAEKNLTLNYEMEAKKLGKLIAKQLICEFLNFRAPSNLTFEELPQALVASLIKTRQLMIAKQSAPQQELNDKEKAESSDNLESPSLMDVAGRINQAEQALKDLKSTIDLISSKPNLPDSSEQISTLQSLLKEKIDKLEGQFQCEVARANFEKIGFFALGIKVADKDIAIAHNLIGEKDKQPRTALLLEDKVIEEKCTIM
jgi:hypothetical protein